MECFSFMTLVGGSPLKILSKLVCSLFVISPLVNAEDTLPDLDLDALMAMDVQVTSAMKRAQSAFETASSIYVLTNEQIVRSGATSIPEALKMVPGLAVRQLDNNQWAISARGVASRFSSKMLVMVDGQSFYTPKFAAVYWETLNVSLYDIERIEVIRGQGGQLWGTNANNGVINIITKNSIDSRGLHADISAGDQINLDANLRYGGDISNKGSYRIHGHVRDGNRSSKGIEVAPVDTTEQHSFGARMDLTPSDEWSVMIQGNLTESDLGQNYRGVFDETNANIARSGILERTDARFMARVENRISADANQMLQASWLKQSGTQAFLQEEYEALDLDYQMNFLVDDWQIDWGVNYRKNVVEFDESVFLTSDREYDALEQYGAFIQAQVALIPDELSLIFGAKSEHNELTGWETQPLARMMWTFSEQQALWTSISQTVRIPTLIEFNDNFAVQGRRIGEVMPTGVPLIDAYRVKTFLNGNDAVKPETSLSYELGYRISKAQWALDVSAYHTLAEDVAVIRSDPNLEQFIPALALLQLGMVNEAVQALSETRIDFNVVSEAELMTEGVDIVLSWQPTDYFSGELGYSYNTFEYDMPDDTFPAIGFDSTSRQLFAKADVDFLEHHNVFATVRVENSDAYQTDTFTAMDIAWNWQLNSVWKLSLTGKNLFAGSHVEYGNTSETYTIANFIDESYTIKITADF